MEFRIFRALLVIGIAMQFQACSGEDSEFQVQKLPNEPLGLSDALKQAEPQAVRAESPQAKPSVPTAVPPAFGFRLRGTVRSVDRSHNIALISYEGALAQPFKLGSQLPNGWILSAVGIDSVVLQEPGRGTSELSLYDNATMNDMEVSANDLRLSSMPKGSPESVDRVANTPERIEAALREFESPARD